nr:K736 [uncultured bacterium]
MGRIFYRRPAGRDRARSAEPGQSGTPKIPLAAPAPVP